MRINPMVVENIVGTTIGLAVIGGIIVATEFGPILVGCPIKGNISKNTGQRIYHIRSNTDRLASFGRAMVLF